MPSFSVRCLFLWANRASDRPAKLYEERITLWQAANIDEAIQLAESEAADYASDGDKYLGLAQAYALYDEVQSQGVEVFSLLRESDLGPDAYLRLFFNTGTERTQ